MAKPKHGSESEREYAFRRRQQECRAALEACSPEAAEAHLQLAELYLARMERADDPVDWKAPGEDGFLLQADGRLLGNAPTPARGSEPPGR